MSDDVTAPASDATDKPETAITNTTQTIVLQNLATINPKHRDILERKHLMDQSNDEIAAALGMTGNSVRSALYRAEQRFRELLSPQQSG